MPTQLIEISNETIRSMKEEIQKAVRKYAKEYQIEPALIKAFIRHESFWYAPAYRIDYNSLRKQKWYIRTLSPEERKYKKYYASYGPMQILYGLAKHYGYEGIPWGLFDPDTGIKYGCIHLKELLSQFKNLKDAIHSYNWGSNAWHDTDGDKIHDSDEKYKNQAYVDSIYSKYKKYGGTQ